MKLSDTKSFLSKIDYQSHLKAADNLLLNCRSQLSELEHNKSIINLFSDRTDVYNLEGHNYQHMVCCSDKLNLDVSQYKDKTFRYRTFLTKNYMPDKYAPDNGVEGYLLLGRVLVSNFNIYPSTIYIDDVDILIKSNFNKRKRTYSLNKECKNYSQIISEPFFNKTFNFIKSMNIEKPSNTPEWLLNYLML